MIKKPTLAGAMTPFPHAVDVESSVVEASALMHHHRVHHLPVTDGESIVGIITAGDIARRAIKPASVRAYHTADPYVVELTTPLDEVLLRMAERQIGCAIVTRHGKLAGIFTYIDVCRTFAVHLRACYPEPPEDAVA